MGGALPFGCIFIQLFFILNSIWWISHIESVSTCVSTYMYICGMCKYWLDISFQVRSDVLHVWFHIPRLPNPCCHLLWDGHIALLLPSLQWGRCGCNNVGVADTAIIKDYRWWWRSFFSSGSTALYLFLFTIHYFYYKLSIQGMASSILYFGYTFIMVLLFFLLTGQCVCVCCVCGVSPSSWCYCSFC